MKKLIYETQHCRAFITNERAEYNYGLPELMIEYTADSPVHAGESIVYGDGDLLPSGVTGGQFVAQMQAASARRRVE